MNTIDIKAFVNSYLTTAAWVTCDSDENQEFTREAKEKAKKDCELFIKKVIEKFGEEKGTELLTIPGNDSTYLAPHDFFLTRNGHGAGFWDREEIYGITEAGELTIISAEMKESYVYHVGGKKSKLTID
jgi:hypothetical protein